MPGIRTTNFVDSNGVDLGKKLVTKDYLLEVYGSILENSPASGLVVTPELWGWGLGHEGQLGINQGNVTRNTPVTTFAGGTNWKQVSAGDHTMVIKTDGTLWGWGSNSYGQLGDNTTTNRSTPVTTFAGGTNWKQVFCRGRHTAAIKTDGSLWTWGNGGEGRLGNFSTTNRSTPVTTFAGGNNWKQVTCGFNQTAAIKTDGTLWIWGSADSGRLGHNNNTDRSTPVTTFAGGTNWKQVASGAQHSAAVKTDGTLWVWGRGNEGQTGTNGSDTNVPVTTFAGGNNWKQVACGFDHQIAIKTDGSLWGWGRNNRAEIGTNDVTQKLTPVTTFAGGNNWKQVACGQYHTAVIKTDGSLWIWGEGGEKLGDNTGATRSIPVTTFAGGNNWKQVSAGFYHTAAIKTIDYI